MLDLDRAIDIAATAASADSASLSHLLVLEQGLSLRFERTGSINDFNRAVDVGTTVVEMLPRDSEGRVADLNKSSIFLVRRFMRLGSEEDLNEAIRILTNALDATSSDEILLASSMNLLAQCLHARFQHTGSIDELNQAIDLVTLACATVPRNHSRRGNLFENLGDYLNLRFDRLGSLNDLNLAIDNISMAIDATPANSIDRAAIMNSFANCLHTRSQETGSMVDLDRAADALATGLNEIPETHPDRFRILTAQGFNHAMRFRLTNSVHDLNRGIDYGKLAVDAAPPGHPDRISPLSNLVCLFAERSQLTGSVEDMHSALLCCQRGWRLDGAHPSYRVLLARIVTELSIDKGDWEEASQLLQEAVNLAPNVSPRSLKHMDKQYALKNFSLLAIDAAAMALTATNDVCHALQLLGRGRGVIAGSLIDMRGDNSQLRLKHADLATEFESLRDDLDSPAEDVASPLGAPSIPLWKSKMTQRREADDRLSELITRIRTLPEFDRFLLAPTSEQLMATADPSPIVVVNLSKYRSDAFIVERNNIRAIKLPDLQLEEAEMRLTQLHKYRRVTSSETMASLLEWLWHAICHPCLNALGLHTRISDTNESWPHIWWIPTGILSQFPLHAAGLYSQGSTDTVLDRTMSSYATSIKALVYARQNLAESKTDTAVLVSMGYTPDVASNKILPSTDREILMLKDLCPSLGLKPITPPQNKQDVINHLRSCKIFRFAGHGQSDPAEPSRSCLLLQDWKTNPLTAGDLRDSRLQENPPILAYLSACSTGTSATVDYIDEDLHLVSSFQLAGFRHVVGTLWEVSDSMCPEVAKVLY